MTAAMVDDVSGIRRTRLDSGLRVVTEHLPGLALGRGRVLGRHRLARRDRTTIAGASHFLEHLLFKGTETRHAAEIAEAVESVGGDMNAFTGQEVTAFYVRVPDRLPRRSRSSILSDIVWSPALRTDEVESERQVILEEIRMRDDTPDDLVHDSFAGALFPGHPLGREVAGTQETITAMTRDAIAEYHARALPARRTWWSRWPGNLDHDDVVADGRAPRCPSHGARAAPARSAAPTPATRAGRACSSDRSSRRTSCSACARSRRDDPDRYALAVVDQVLGGGMSSRLFQEVREKRGLAYSVFSYRSAFEETGALGVYCGTAPERVDEVLDVVRGELDRLVADGGVTERELAERQGSPDGSLALSLESSSSRMHRIGRAELTLGEIPSLDEVVEQVEAVTADDIARVDRPGARRRARAPSPWSGPVTEVDLAPHGLDPCAPIL